MFDCANPCGRIGRRSLSVDSHIRMMAAVQPFILGAISSSDQHAERGDRRGLQGGLHAVLAPGLQATALYRDGSKLSQPLASSLLGDDEEAEEFFTELPAARAPLVAERIVERVVERMVERVVRQSERRRLPNRRKGYTQKAVVGGQQGVVSPAGDSEDGGLGEVFIDMQRRVPPSAP